MYITYAVRASSADRGSSKRNKSAVPSLKITKRKGFDYCNHTRWMGAALLYHYRTAVYCTVQYSIIKVIALL